MRHPENKCQIILGRRDVSSSPESGAWLFTAATARRCKERLSQSTFQAYRLPSHKAGLHGGAWFPISASEISTGRFPNSTLLCETL